MEEVQENRIPPVEALSFVSKEQNPSEGRTIPSSLSTTEYLYRMDLQIINGLQTKINTRNNERIEERVFESDSWYAAEASGPMKVYCTLLCDLLSSLHGDGKAEERFQKCCFLFWCMLGLIVVIIVIISTENLEALDEYEISEDPGLDQLQLQTICAECRCLDSIESFEEFIFLREKYNNIYELVFYNGDQIYLSKEQLRTIGQTEQECEECDPSQNYTLPFFSEENILYCTEFRKVN
eukprot:snap_masked-scaffold_8-processed-gene-11.25-mRNA-1 protein AED:1.00 eAED:1.00 QI:0/0/0/0/1/1/2/0/237